MMGLPMQLAWASDCVNMVAARDAQLFEIIGI
jgi:hypothetical protein